MSLRSGKLPSLGSEDEFFDHKGSRHPKLKLNAIIWIPRSPGQIAKLIHPRRRNSNPGVHGSLNQAILRQIRQIWVGSGRCRVGRHKFCFGDLRIGKTKPGNASTTDRRIWWYCAGTAATATANDDCDSHESEKNEPCCRLCWAPIYLHIP